ncbi:MAG: hypothetical protein ACI9NC_004949, partial [Verrucomicrobiales bacterium]
MLGHFRGSGGRDQVRLNRLLLEQFLVRWNGFDEFRD